jgi:WD40 repeat protein
MAEKNEEFCFQDHRNTVSSVNFSRDGIFLAGGSYDNIVGL